MIVFLADLDPTQLPILTAMYLAVAVGMVLLSYYSLKIFYHMRSGRLERGWKLTTEGMVFMSSSFVLIAISHLLSRDSRAYFYLGVAGTALMLVGVGIMLLGLHSHYLVWYRKASTHEEKIIDRQAD
jgi:uncharacterized membrane protein